MGTLFGTGGPFYVIYLQYRGLEKSVFRATMASVFLLDGASRIGGYLITGMYRGETWWLFLLAVPVMVLALFIGGRIHTSITAETFRRAIGVMLIGSGLMLMLR